MCNRYAFLSKHKTTNQRTVFSILSTGYRRGRGSSLMVCRIFTQKVRYPIFTRFCLFTTYLSCFSERAHSLREVHIFFLFSSRVMSSSHTWILSILNTLHLFKCIYIFFSPFLFLFPPKISDTRVVLYLAWLLSVKHLCSFLIFSNLFFVFPPGENIRV